MGSTAAAEHRGDLGAGRWGLGYGLDWIGFFWLDWFGWIGLVWLFGWLIVFVLSMTQ